MTAGRGPTCGKRARERTTGGRPTAVDALRDAVASGRTAAVAATLHATVTLVVDGGGRVPAPTAPVRGRTAVAAALLDVLPPDARATARVVSVNGAPALVLRRRAGVMAVVVTAVRRRRIATVWVVVNPDKLSRWNRSS
ncbi:siderophore-interacting protein [Microbacterium lushaniae]|uniref:Siderophore-interacting protein n=1 Tax=Microbacterium lushaniae TaxID=2614639 RepID=A0A5J6L4M6_9MICO|nr:siderophore-interacting protein [Microbacterium lushaniae]QEW03483.1 siderophore-interacting protein [Microbacterium lushaniae]